MAEYKEYDYVGFCPKCGFKKGFGALSMDKKTICPKCGRIVSFGFIDPNIDPNSVTKAGCLPVIVISFVFGAGLTYALGTFMC